MENENKKGVMRHRVAIAENNKQEQENSAKQMVGDREKRKKGEIITHRATCKIKYHLFVYYFTVIHQLLYFSYDRSMIYDI